MVDEQHHHTVFSEACDADSEILAALQTMTVETAVRTQRHRLDADIFFRCSPGVGHGVDFEQRVVTFM